MRPWTEEEKQMLRELYPVTTAPMLVPILGRSARAIAQMAVAMRIEKVIHVTRNPKPIGSERLDRGILIRKVTDIHRSKKDWRRVDELMWEEVHGPIPEGYHLMLIDGKLPRTLSNLALYTKEEHLARISVHALPPEIAGLYQLRGQITKAINRRKRAETTAPSEKSAGT